MFVSLLFFVEMAAADPIGCVDPAPPRFAPAESDWTGGWTLRWTAPEGAESELQRATSRHPDWITVMDWSVTESYLDPLETVRDADELHIGYRVRSRIGSAPPGPWTMFEIMPFAAPPNAPRVRVATWDEAGTAIQLDWELLQSAYEVGGTRSEPGGRNVVDLGWQGVGVTRLTDRTADPAKHYTYVLRLRDGAGRMAADTASITVPAASAGRKASWLRGWYDSGAHLRWEAPEGAGVSARVDVLGDDGTWSPASCWLSEDVTETSVPMSGHHTYRITTRTRRGVEATSESIQIYDPWSPVLPEPPIWSDEPGLGWDRSWTTVTLPFGADRTDLEVKVQHATDGVTFADRSPWIPVKRGYFEDVHADPSGSNWYRLIARTRVGIESDPAASAVLEVPGQDQVPTSPEIFAGWNTAGTAVAVSWAPARDGVEIQVQRSRWRSGEYSDVSGWLPSGAHGWTDTSNDGKQDVAYRLVARSAAGTGRPSATGFVQAVNQPPDSVGWLRATWNRSGTAVMLKWTDYAHRTELGYALDRSDDGGVTWTSITAASDPWVDGDGTFSAMDSAAPQGVPLVYRIVATTPDGTASPDPPRASVQPATATPSPPTWVRGHWLQDHAVRLRWEPAEYGLEWQVERSGDGRTWVPLHAAGRTTSTWPSATVTPTRPPRSATASACATPRAWRARTARSSRWCRSPDHRDRKAKPPRTSRFASRAPSSCSERAPPRCPQRANANTFGAAGVELGPN
jgi:hypothetical protein